jgi:hypothetical protein
MLSGGLTLLISLASLTMYASGQTQTGNSATRSPIRVTHILGLGNVRRNVSGELSVNDGELRFQPHGTLPSRLNLASIQSISLGEQIKATRWRADDAGPDFALDLLFFRRGLVAIELKVGRFEAEYVGKLNFYLKALDRHVRKAHERSAIGVLLFASKDNEVVEYTLSRSLSPSLIAKYQTQLPEKKLLQAKLHELYQVRTRSRKTPISKRRDAA